MRALTLLFTLFLSGLSIAGPTDWHTESYDVGAGSPLSATTFYGLLHAAPILAVAVWTKSRFATVLTAGGMVFVALAIGGARYAILDLLFVGGGTWLAWVLAFDRRQENSVRDSNTKLPGARLSTVSQAVVPTRSATTDGDELVKGLGLHLEEWESNARAKIEVELPLLIDKWRKSGWFRTVDFEQQGEQERFAEKFVMWWIMREVTLEDYDFTPEFREQWRATFSAPSNEIIIAMSEWMKQHGLLTRHDAFIQYMDSKGYRSSSGRHKDV